ncbi:uncharacterized protein [Typha latifolia]|uniref:uncharacterized protein n=1 Tax=Typha latifolia TaxID=4733 RepID=UPI003C2D9B61
MEDLRLDLMRKSAVIEEDDEIYEDIEAPKFVDFTVPDRSRPDDSSWFCVRIGCNQNHEQVDPDALHKHFVLRVMAARSPNVRLHKSLYRQDGRSSLKCPHSAPAKPPKCRIMRASTVTSIPEKMANAKIKNHPISSLRSTPTQPKTRAQAPTAEKALTTPRNRKSLAKQEPFLSVKYQKRPIAAPRNGTVVKALFANMPKEATENTPPPPKSQIPVSDVCTKMKKLNLASKKKIVPSRYLSSTKGSNRGEESATNSKKTNLSSLRKCNHPGLEERKNKTKIPPSSNTTECASSNDLTTQNFKEDLESKHLLLQDPKNVEHVNEFDDDKENVSVSDKTRDVIPNTAHYKSENLQSRTSENVPQKVIKAQHKSHGNSDNGGKQKKTTNPKPFRLRTDERGILKEANSERRRLQIEPQKETKTAFGHGDGICQNKRKSHGKSSKVIKQRSSATARQVEETKLVSSNLQLQKKLETRKETAKVASSKRSVKTASLTSGKSRPCPHMKKKTREEKSTNQNS